MRSRQPSCSSRHYRLRCTRGSVRRVPLPMDSHVHSEWSWDAPGGTMERTCARAVSLGLPAVAFTEHADYSPWIILPSDLEEHVNLQAFATAEGTIQPAELNLDGYLASLARCRDLFPALRIVSGVELGEPHRHDEVVRRLCVAGEFERVLGSLHSLPLDEQFSEMPTLFSRHPPEQVIRDYLAEVALLIARSDTFGVLAHIGYAVRYWPETAGPFHPEHFEEEFRYALRMLAESGRTYEVNTRAALLPEVVRWWRQEGGRTVTFGSDAHEPSRLAFQFGEAAAMVEAHGFRPGRDPWDVWNLPG